MTPEPLAKAILTRQESDPNNPEKNVIPISHSPRSSSQSRITLIEQVFYQASEGNPIGIETKSSRFVETDEQPYPDRVIKVGEQWKPISLGWFADKPEEIGMVVIKNLGRPTKLSGNPTKEQKMDIESAILDVCCRSEESRIFADTVYPIDMFILPGQSQRTTPTYPKFWLIRCRKGETKVQILIFPK